MSNSMSLDINLDLILSRIREVADKATNEEELRINVENILKAEVIDKLNLPWGKYEVNLKIREVGAGRADAVYGYVVIEYERPKALNTQSGYNHAFDQVENYIKGLAESEAKKRRLDVEQLYKRYLGVIFDGYKIGFLKYSDGKWVREGPHNLNRFSLAQFIIALRSLNRKALTGENIVKDFGSSSPVAKAFVSSFFRKLLNPRSKRTTDLFTDWVRIFRHIYQYNPKKLENIAKTYGIPISQKISDEDRLKLFFAVHTYHALIVKLISAEVATAFRDSYLRSYIKKLIDASKEGRLKETLVDLENGAIFSQLGVRNFLEGDYFLWYLDEWDDDLTNAFTLLVSKLMEYEIATHELRPEYVRDMFKELYESLVPPEVRHDLGEYYTPDWLAELTLNESLKKLSQDEKIEDIRILDPACGSGTFLVSAITKLKGALSKKYGQNRKEILKILTNAVVGFDANPLAVLTARANYIIALGDLMNYIDPNDPIELPVYLSNSMIAETYAIMSPKYKIEVENVKIVGEQEELSIPRRVINSGLLTKVIEILSEVLTIKTKEDEVKILRYKLRNIGLSETEIECLIKGTYIKLKRLHEEYRDEVWLRIIRNTFAPSFKGKFKLIVGNPPWVVLRYIADPKYQEKIKDLMSKYGLTARAELITQMEIATLFFLRSVELYLNDGGIIAFVMPRSVFVADQHEAFREGKLRIKRDQEYKPVGFIKFIDCKDVEPLFNVPACVIIARLGLETNYPVDTIIVKGKLPRKNLPLNVASEYLSQKDAKYDLYIAGERSFVDLAKSELLRSIEKSGGRSPYYERFRVGATLFPRSLVFVDVKGIDPSGLVYIESSKRSEVMGQNEYKDTKLEGFVESDFLYATLTSSSLLPFGHLEPFVIVIPVELIEKKLSVGENYVIELKLLTKEDAIKKGLKGIASWTNKCEKVWNDRRGEKAEKMDWYTRLNYRKDLTKQDLNKRYRVLYPVSATYIVSCVVDTHDPDFLTIEVGDKKFRLKGFIADYTTYYLETDSESEAYYLAALLNSTIIDNLVKPMQAKGRFGPRHIVKKVLELPIPEYDPNNPDHQRLVELSKKAHEKVREIIPKILEEYRGKIITPQIVGRIRNKVKKEITNIIAEIDEIVIKLLGDLGKKASGGLLKFFDLY